MINFNKAFDSQSNNSDSITVKVYHCFEVEYCQKIDQNGKSGEKTKKESQTTIEDLNN